jgi:hypothetical protein
MNNAKFTEADLIAFGNYLLSDKRNNNIQKREPLSYVSDSDVANWIETLK